MLQNLENRHKKVGFFFRSFMAFKKNLRDKGSLKKKVLYFKSSIA